MCKCGCTTGTINYLVCTDSTTFVASYTCSNCGELIKCIPPKRPEKSIKASNQ